MGKPQADKSLQKEYWQWAGCIIGAFSLLAVVLFGMQAYFDGSLTNQADQKASSAQQAEDRREDQAAEKQRAIRDALQQAREDRRPN